MRIHPRWPIALGAAAVAMVAAIALFGGTTGTVAVHNLRPSDAAVVARGESIYRTHCAGCHGADLQGQPNWRERGPDGRLPAPPHDASGHTWHHSDDVLFKLTKHGLAKVAKLKDYNSAMPVYEGVLTDAEIIAVLSWIKAQWPAEVRARQDEVNRRAKP
jgi:mono/diheme cytochrome c family protein